MPAISTQLCVFDGPAGNDLGYYFKEQKRPKGELHLDPLPDTMFQNGRFCLLFSLNKENATIRADLCGSTALSLMILLFVEL